MLDHIRKIIYVEQKHVVEFALTRPDAHANFKRGVTGLGQIMGAGQSGPHVITVQTGEGETDITVNKVFFCPIDVYNYVGFARIC